jgi:oxygen-independent coproporphyrinogen-3 oxidase
VSLGVYVHLPFCRVHCTYCPFAISTDIALQDAYVEALVREIGSRACPPLTIDSIYFGGGTPSRTSIENLRRVVEALGSATDVIPSEITAARVDAFMTRPSPGLRPPSPRSRGARGNSTRGFPSPRSRGEGARRADEGRVITSVSEESGGTGDASTGRRRASRPPRPLAHARGDTFEFSIEANPEDINAESLRAWQELGVNRVSIGVQSFNDAELAAIGRVHDAARAREAAAMAVESGVRTNLDLILGLPHQTPESFESTLTEAIDLGAGHLSLYMLDLEEGTPLHAQVARGRVEVGDDEQVASLYRRAIDRLEAAGLAQYEISNFARVGEECAHNLRYWTRGEYHGFGLGAHSFIGEERFANTRNIRDYIADPEHARDFIEQLGEAERRRELLFLGLRQTGGMYYEELTRLGGKEANEWIERGLQDGWLRQSGGRVAFTSSGFLLSNDYISQLF